MAHDTNLRQARQHVINTTTGNVLQKRFLCSRRSARIEAASRHRQQIPLNNRPTSIERLDKNRLQQQEPCDRAQVNSDTTLTHRCDTDAPCACISGGVRACTRATYAHHIRACHTQKKSCKRPPSTHTHTHTVDVNMTSTHTRAAESQSLQDIEYKERRG